MQATWGTTKLTLEALPYPNSGQLYKGARAKNPINVFDFKNDLLGSASVQETKTVPKVTSEYATEHIIEVSVARGPYGTEPN